MHHLIEYLHRQRQEEWQAYERFRSHHNLFEAADASGILHNVKDYLFGTVMIPDAGIVVDASAPAPTGNVRQAS